MSRAHDSPSELVAIAVAAHKAGDRELERYAKRALAEQHGVRIVFERTSKPRPKEASSHA